MRKKPKSGARNLAAEDFATADDAVITTSSKLTDEEILQDATQAENDEAKEIEDDDKELVAPSTTEVENSFKILKNLSLFSEKRGDQMQDLINRFETLFTRDRVKKCKQVKITFDLFCKRKINLHCHTLLFFIFIGSFTQTRLGLLEALS